MTRKLWWLAIAPALLVGCGQSQNQPLTSDKTPPTGGLLSKPPGTTIPADEIPPNYPLPTPAVDKASRTASDAPKTTSDSDKDASKSSTSDSGKGDAKRANKPADSSTGGASGDAKSGEPRDSSARP